LEIPYRHGMTRQFARPLCPKCKMHMIAIKGIMLDVEHKTFECLRCGTINGPGARDKGTASPDDMGAAP
jgi:hypothetical protein